MAYDKEIIGWFTRGGSHIPIRASSEFEGKTETPESITSKYMNNYIKTETNKKYGKDEVGVAEETQKVSQRASNELKTFKKEGVNKKKVIERGGVTGEEADECIKVAEKVYSEAEKHEPEISKDLIDNVKKVNGKMYGLDFRMKQVTSMAGKIGDDAKKNNWTFEEAGDDIKDAVRYTMILNDSSFVKDYNKIKSSLEAKGYKEVRLKNFYQMYEDGESQQKAVQCVYQTKDGYVFELQFHTNNSQGAKELNHPLYEEWRNASTSQKRKDELDERMKNIAKYVKNPKDILSIKSHK